MTDEVETAAAEVAAAEAALAAAEAAQTAAAAAETPAPATETAPVVPAVDAEAVDRPSGTAHVVDTDTQSRYLNDRVAVS